MKGERRIFLGEVTNPRGLHGFIFSFRLYDFLLQEDKEGMYEALL